MPTSSTQRVICQKHLESAQGYLELALLFEDQWPLPPELKQTLADHAISSLECASQRHGTQSHWQFLRGLAHQLHGQLPQAISLLNQACNESPAQPEIYLHLSWCHRQQEQWQQAIAILENGLQQVPDHPFLLYNLGCYYCLTQQMGPCFDCLQQAVKREPTLRSRIPVDPDLVALKADPRFQELLHLSLN